MACLGKIIVVKEGKVIDEASCDCEQSELSKVKLGSPWW